MFSSIQSSLQLSAEAQALARQELFNEAYGIPKDYSVYFASRNYVKLRTEVLNGNLKLSKVCDYIKFALSNSDKNVYKISPKKLMAALEGQQSILEKHVTEISSLDQTPEETNVFNAAKKIYNFCRHKYLQKQVTDIQATIERSLGLLPHLNPKPKRELGQQRLETIIEVEEMKEEPNDIELTIFGRPSTHDYGRGLEFDNGSGVGIF